MEGKLKLSELSSLIKRSLNENFSDSYWVIAEISEYKVNRNGHCYLELVEKEDDTDEITARIKATIWSWQHRFIEPFFQSTTGKPLSHGLKVLVSATVEFHEVYGFSLNINDIEPSFTLGDIALKRKEIIKQLQSDGVFDMNKELELVAIPNRIAIISSSTAAGYGDFIDQLTNNTKQFHFTYRLFEAYMQGNDAPQSIINALDCLYDSISNFDVVVIIRGGGSQLDLSCFDNYELAYHISQFPLPVLTGIGHEKDESIADLVSHTRLKTPTAVAEFLISKIEDFAINLSDCEAFIRNYLNNYFDIENTRIQSSLRLFNPLVSEKLSRTSSKLLNLSGKVIPITKSKLQYEINHLEKIDIKLRSTLRQSIHYRKSTLSKLTREVIYSLNFRFEKDRQYLGSLTKECKKNSKLSIIKRLEKLELYNQNLRLVDPITILKRGFSITLLNGKAVKNNDSLKIGETIESIIYKGKVTSVITKNE